MELDEARASINSEMRFIALELMKIAYRKRVPFKKVAAQFVKNVYSLEKLVRSPARARPRAAMRKVGAESKR